MARVRGTYEPGHARLTALFADCSPDCSPDEVAVLHDRFTRAGHWPGTTCRRHCRPA